jgi:SAM-dependent methyltransferase
MGMKAIQKSPPIPLKFGSQRQFDSVRDLLVASGYTTEAVCKRLGISSVFELETSKEGPLTAAGLESRADVLIWLFLGANQISRDEAGRFFADTELESLAELGLLEPDSSENGIQATVLVYPIEFVYLASDLPINRADGSPTAFPDSVYPPFTVSAGRFLSMLPRTPCDSFLELCGGTGIAALLAAQSASRSCSVDITERSTVFARFNAALNGTPTFRALQGDLYHPIGDEKFDRIVAHPPYMPATENARIFRDGGPDGEDITRRIVQGLADHLQPGGCLYLTASLSDRLNAPVETRVREMLGPAASEFDVTVITFAAFHPLVHYGAELWRGTATATEVEPLLDHLRTLGIRQMVMCSVVVQRPETRRAVFTTRRLAGPQCNADALEWLLRWEAKATDPDLDQWLAHAAPRSSDTLELRVSHRMEPGEWKPVGLELRTSSPFQEQVTCGAWVAEFLRRCDGRRSAISILQSMKEDGAVPMDAPEHEFCEMVKGLAAGGFLQFDDL